MSVAYGKITHATFPDRSKHIENCLARQVGPTRLRTHLMSLVPSVDSQSRRQRYVVCHREHTRRLSLFIDIFSIYYLQPRIKFSDNGHSLQL